MQEVLKKIILNFFFFPTRVIEDISMKIKPEDITLLIVFCLIINNLEILKFLIECHYILLLK